MGFPRGTGAAQPTCGWAPGGSMVQQRLTSRLLAAFDSGRSRPLPMLGASRRLTTICTAEGLQFVPLVAEGCGGVWGPAAIRTWRDLGKAAATTSGEAVSVEVERILQALAVTLQRENARAVLRRKATSTSSSAASFAEP